MLTKVFTLLGVMGVMGVIHNACSDDHIFPVLGYTIPKSHFSSDQVVKLIPPFLPENQGVSFRATLSIIPRIHMRPLPYKQAPTLVYIVSYARALQTRAQNVVGTRIRTRLRYVQDR